MISFSEKKYKLKNGISTKLYYIRISTCTCTYVGILFTENGKMVKENYQNEKRRPSLFFLVVEDGLNDLE